MNKLFILIALLAWASFSLALVLSVVGLVLFIRADYNTEKWQGDEGTSTWNKIGFALVNKLIED